MKTKRTIYRHREEERQQISNKGEEGAVRVLAGIHKACKSCARWKAERGAVQTLEQFFFFLNDIMVNSSEWKKG